MEGEDTSTPSKEINIRHLTEEIRRAKYEALPLEQLDEIERAHVDTINKFRSGEIPGEAWVDAVKQHKERGRGKVIVSSLEELRAAMKITGLPDATVEELVVHEAEHLHFVTEAGYTSYRFALQFCRTSDGQLVMNPATEFDTPEEWSDEETRVRLTDALHKPNDPSYTDLLHND